MDFKIYFNRHRQWLDVTLWEVHPSTFARWKAGRWAYFVPTWNNPKVGVFGELHFIKSRLRFDVIAHEVFHVVMEYVWANRDAVTGRNEERYASLVDELSRKIVREARKLKILL